MFTSSKDRPAIGINDPLIWSLLVCAIVVALGAFILLRDQTMTPVGGFGGRSSERGFPRQAGGFSLQGVKEEGGIDGAAEYLAALYQRGASTPVTLEFHPIPEGVEPRVWLDTRVAEARQRKSSVESRGRVVQAASENRKAKHEGSFVRLHGELPGDPVSVIWTQQIAGRPYGFVLYAPSFEVVEEFTALFPRTILEEQSGIEVGVEEGVEAPSDHDDLPRP